MSFFRFKFCSLTKCIFVLTLLSSCVHHHTTDAGQGLPADNSCHETRAAFDIGSGSTSVKVAIVDICTMTVYKTLLEDKEKVAYREDLAKSKDSTFSAEIMSAGLETLKKFNDRTKAFSPKVTVAAATSAYRQARNSLEMVGRIERETGLKVKTISQEEEGEIGFWSARGSTEVVDKKIAVLDIGGGSTQLSVQGSNLSDPPVVIEGPIASVSFKELILNKVLKTGSAKSPNPLGQRNLQAARRTAESSLADFSKKVAQLVKDDKPAIVGIGNVFGYSILDQVKPLNNKLTQTAIERTILERVTWTDEKFDSKYAETDYTNLILVLGFMQALKTESIQIVKTNLTDGLLLGKVRK